MKYSVAINGRERALELTGGERLSCRLDGEPFEAEAVEIQPGVFSLLLGGKSFQVRVAPAAGASGDGAAASPGNYAVQVDGSSYSVAVNDPRRRPRDRGRSALEGKQNITAPMPGKVVRILVSEGQSVESGQGLIVVEAMKMQNEIRSRAAGSIQKILVREGQAVNAAETLLIME
jgi:biotin carboxyl carrier protein